MQDGTAPHTSNVVLDFLRAIFGSNLISLKTATEWPPHSPDLNPLDFFLWEFIEDKVYDPKPQRLDELKATYCSREIRKITASTCQNVIGNFQRRMTLLRQKAVRHLEHVL